VPASARTGFLMLVPAATEHAARTRFCSFAFLL
jgi:hypothetical protein